MSFLRAIAMKNQKTREVKISDQVAKVSFNDNEKCTGTGTFLQIKFQGNKSESMK